MKDDRGVKDDANKIPTIKNELKELLRKHSKKKHVKTTLKVLDKAIQSDGDMVVKLFQDWESYGSN